MKDTKDHILRISLRLFLRKSCKEVTMQEIARETGFSKGAFYHYFTDKEQLFEEAVRYFFEQNMFDISANAIERAKRKADWNISDIKKCRRRVVQNLVFSGYVIMGKSGRMIISIKYTLTHEKL